MKNLLVLILLMLCLSGISQTRLIPVNDEAIRYVGRFDFSNPQEVRYDWSGVYIQFRFRGSECAVKMSDTGHNYYNVFVDDQPSKTIDVKSDTTIVTCIASDFNHCEMGLQGEGIRIKTKFNYLFQVWF